MANFDTPIDQLHLGIGPFIDELTARARQLTLGQLLQLANQVQSAAVADLTWEDLMSLSNVMKKATAGNFGPNGEPTGDPCCCCPACCCCCT